MSEQNDGGNGRKPGRIAFKPEFTFGTLLQLVTLIFLAGGFYYKSQEDFNAINRRMDAYETLLNKTIDTQNTMAVTVEKLATMIDDDRRFRNSEHNNHNETQAPYKK